MYTRWLALCATLFLASFAAFADVGGPAAPPFLGFEDTYQVTYFSATNTNNGVLNLFNAGAYTQPNPNINQGWICANIYVFASNSPNDPNREQMASCCTCPITRNGSRNVFASELLSNSLLPGPFTSATVKVVWTKPANDSPGNCTATALPTTNAVAPPVGPVDPAEGFATGGRCSATRWHAAQNGAPPLPAFGSETECMNAPLSGNERNLLSGLCNIIWFSLGSGAGQCARCPGNGSQGAIRK